jgi:hypothetical protein
MMPSNDTSIGETSLRHPGDAAQSVAPENAKNALPRCQTCRSVAIRRSHRTGFSEKALSLISIYPYHCHACKARSLLRVAAVAAGARVSEKRRERVQADAKRNRRLVLLSIGSIALFLLLAKLFILKPPSMTGGE